ncbi:MAG TPA: hypothetical protein VER11_23535 [Polyangiaceae bacterium]|nr:hypothetical protein [Polyangiaceae bacterium]
MGADSRESTKQRVRALSAGLRTAMSGASLAFFAWYALVFIRRASFVVADKRHFVLFDDGMISMRYAWNLSHGLGLVWNVGERVEGFTNPLWVLVMSVATFAFDKNLACLAMQILGATVVAFGGWMFSMAFEELALAQAQKHGVSPPWQLELWKLLTFISCLAPYPILYWSLTGMEVSLLTALLGALFYVVARYERAPSPTLATLAGSTAALCYLTRPDGVILALPPLLVLALRSKANIRVLCRLFAPLVMTIVCIIALRYAYYGELVPNTYVLKMQGIPLGERLKNGRGFVEPFWRSAAGLYVFALVGAVLLRRAMALALFAVPLAILGYQILVGGDPWPYWRMLAPGLPCLVVLGMLSISWSWPSRFKAWRYLAGPLAVLTMVSALYRLNKPFAGEYWSGPPYQREYNESNVRHALVLDRLLDKDAKVAVFFAGTVPYLTGRYAIDVLGKCDRHVARLPPDLSGRVSWYGMSSVPGHNKYDLEYSLISQRPDYFELSSWGNQSLTTEELAQFETVTMDGVTVSLRKDSPHVNWSAIPGR